MFHYSGCYIFIFKTLLTTWISAYTLRQGHQLKDGEFLVSAGKVFTLGHFSPQEEKTTGYFNLESAHNRFIGIWYTEDERQTPVWVANRNNPVTRASGAIEIDKNGGLKVSDNDGQISIILSFKSPGTFKTEVSAVLTDTGNFILREMNLDGVESAKILWQSFDYPTDSLLPGMKLGLNLKTGQKWSLTSWVSSKVPALGPYTLGLDPNGTNQLVLWRRGVIHWKSGKWHDGRFSNLEDYLYSFDYVSNKDETYFVLSTMSTWYINFPMYQINALGAINRVDFNKKNPYQTDMSSPTLSEVVSCKRIEETRGCIGHKLSECRSNSSKVWFESTKGYVKFNGLKYEKSRYILGLDDCEVMCLNSCSCVAYAYIYPNVTGCELWSNLTQLVEDGNHGYRDLHLQREHYHYHWEEPKTSRWIWVIVGTSIFIVTLLLAWLGYRMKKTLLTVPWLTYMKKILLTVAWVGYRMKNILLAVARFFGLLIVFLQQRVRTNVSRFYDHIQRRIETVQIQTGGKTLSSVESSSGYSGRFQRKRKVAFVKKSHGIRVFSFESMAQATNNFDLSNVLGQGGYGIVYKGLLEDGQEIAIKRLSATSKQGKSEFMNELKLVAKLQHTNLVNLIGCCVEQGEKIVVYEFMPNKSLDFFIFDTSRRLLLDWTQRFNIIEGVAQGLLYLHKYSRLKIIHRDLKTGNILLDEEMNPKISDFGMARLFEQNESGANTNTVRGTLGYMPPEYALDGYFSVKTDVFSFGVLLLEIISSKKNNGTYSSDRPLSLIGYAWELWKENRGTEFIDHTLILSGHEHEQALKCINLGLLCVQEQASDRPTMSTVVGWISNDATELPNPKKPAFFFDNNAERGECSRHDLEQGSLNNASISGMEAR